MIRRIATTAAFAGVILVAASSAVASIALVVRDEPAPTAEERRLTRELEELEREHAALEEWVEDELGPWAEEIGEALPSSSPAPSLESPAPPTPSSVPTPSSEPPSVVPSPNPTPPAPTVSSSPSPSDACLPVVDICL